MTIDLIGNIYNPINSANLERLRESRHSKTLESVDQSKAEFPATTNETNPKNSGGAQSRAVMKEEQTVDNLDFFEESKLTLKSLFNPTRRTANRLFQRTLTDEQFELAKELAQFVADPKTSDEIRKSCFSACGSIMKETGKHTPMTSEIVTAVCGVAARHGTRVLPAVTAALQSIKEPLSPALITYLGAAVCSVADRTGRYAPDSLQAFTTALTSIKESVTATLITELGAAVCSLADRAGGHAPDSLQAFTTALKEISGQTEIKPEGVKAICLVAARAGKYAPDSLPALTAALTSIKEPVTPALITELGAAVCKAANSAGEYAHDALPALTAALESIKEPVTTALINDFGAAVCSVAASAGNQARHALPALTAALTSIKEPVTTALINDFGAAVCSVAASAGVWAFYALPALTAALKGIGTQTAITPEIVKAVCSVAASAGYRSEYALPALTEALHEIGSKTEITPEIVKAVCSVAASAGNQARYALPALTKTLKAIKEPVTTTLITELGEAIRSVATRAGNQAQYALPALTAALTSIKEPVTPALITELGAAVCSLDISAGLHTNSALPALTAALTSIKEPVTPTLITKLGAAVRSVAASADQYAPKSLSALTAALQEIGTKTEITPEIVEAVCSVATRAGYQAQYALPALTEALKGIGTQTAITPEIVKAVCSVAASRGAFPPYELPALTAALMSIKEPVTPALITELGAAVCGVAASACESAHYVLPALTEALKGIGTQTAITPEIVKAVCSVAASAGNQARYALPAVTKTLKAIKEPVTPALITELGATVRSVAASAGGWADRVLPALTAALQEIGTQTAISSSIIEATGRFISTVNYDAAVKILNNEIRHGRQLKTPSDLDKLTSAIYNVNSHLILGTELKPKSTDPKDTLHSSSHTFVTPENELRKLVFSEYNSYGRSDFESRLKNWDNKNLPPAMKVKPERSFEVKVRAGEPTLRIVPGMKLNEQLFNAVSAKVTISNDKIPDRVKSIYPLAGITIPENLPDPTTTEGRKEVFLILKTIPQEKLKSALKALQPVLPTLCQSPISLPSFGSTENPNLTGIKTYYETVKATFDHIQDVLQRNGVTISKENKQIVFDNFTKPITEELNKFRLSGAKNTETVQLVGTKNVFDLFYDSIGESCCGNEDLQRHDFQPIRLVDPATLDHYGVVYAVKSKVNGRPAMVLFGVEIRRKYAYAINQNDLMAGLIPELAKVAEDNGLKILCTTTDSTRLAQYDVTRAAVMARTIAETTVNDGIRFPSHYSLARQFALLWAKR